MKLNVSIQEVKIIGGIRHMRKFHLHTDASRDTWCASALNMQLPAERAIHLMSSNGWAEFWPEPMIFLVDMLNHAHY